MELGQMKIDFSNNDSERRDWLVVALLLVLAFGLAAYLHPRLEALFTQRADSDDPLAVLLGDTRQMFANSFFIKADAYFHSGYYPTIYDNNAPFKTPHMARIPARWKARTPATRTIFSANRMTGSNGSTAICFPRYHTHLDQGGASGDLGDSSEVKEIMPWLKISEELDAASH